MKRDGEVFAPLAVQRGCARRHRTNQAKDLTTGVPSVEDGSTNMKKMLSGAALCGAMCILVLAVRAGNAQPRLEAPPQQSGSTVRVTIEVTGGEKDAPVENASVYLKYVEEHKLRKDRKYELNVKTNREGIAHVPDAPLGKVLIQIVAEGWKTYGKWYAITEAKEPIKIHLERPPKWY
jgi:hypothetical protein